jgi:extracellular elastinolytic metalloproteinase
VGSRLSKAAVALVAVSAFALLAASVGVAAPPGKEKQRHGRANYDVRSSKAVVDRAAELAAHPSAAVAAFERSLGTQGLVTLDGLTGTPRMVGRLDGYLTGPSSASAAQVALDYVGSHADVFRVDVSSLQQTRESVSPNGTRHVWWRQVVGGIPVFGNGLKANVAADGRLINIVGSPLATLGGAASAPALTAEEALAQTRRDAGAAVAPLASTKKNDARRSTTFVTGEKAGLTIFATANGNRLGWDLLVAPDASSLYRQVVDAQTGAILFRQSLVQSSTGLFIRNYPGAPSGGSQVIVDLSENGWLPAGSKYLSGPNTHVYADVNANNVAEQPEEINPSSKLGNNRSWLWPLLQFTPNVTGCATFVCTWDPFLTGSWSRNQNQSGEQLFAAINTFHDHLEAAPIGFDNDDGNFEGDDPVNGEALDGAKTFQNMPDGNHIDNANFGTPPDGDSPRMQMFLFHTPFAPSSADPFIAADGSNETGIVYHENTHGLSNRLVVDADGFSTLGGIQAGAMGEAWSDWYAYDFLHAQGLQPDVPNVADVRVGHYVGGGQDLIRFEPIDCKIGQAAGCPGGVQDGEGNPLTGTGGFTYGDYGKVNGTPEVHSDGEIWVQTLWDLRDELGSATSEGIVTEAMRLSPFNPSFLEMRNAILQADLTTNSGDNEDTIWAVFAHRGMGFFAGAIDGDDAQPVEDFSMPPAGVPDATLAGSVTDFDSGGPIDEAIVAFGGHTNGAGAYVDTTDATGAYSIADIFSGTYPKISARAPGFDTVVLDELTVAPGANLQNFALRRDWASARGGGSIAAFNGPDYTPFGCGPVGAIDQSQGTGWGSDTDHDALVTGLATDKFIVVKLPAAVDISEIRVNPSNTCGDPGSSSTRGFRIETSTDGTTFQQVSEGVFYRANRNTMNTVTLGGPGTLDGVQFVRFNILNPQVPTDPSFDPNNPPACTGPADCGTDPDDDSGVAAHCGTGKDNGYGGCQFVDMTELVVYGTRS